MQALLSHIVRVDCAPREGSLVRVLIDRVLYCWLFVHVVWSAVSAAKTVSAGVQYPVGALSSLAAGTNGRC